MALSRRNPYLVLIVNENDSYVVIVPTYLCTAINISSLCRSSSNTRDDSSVAPSSALALIQLIRPRKDRHRTFILVRQYSSHTKLLRSGNFNHPMIGHWRRNEVTRIRTREERLRAQTREHTYMHTILNVINVGSDLIPGQRAAVLVRERVAKQRNTDSH